MWIKRSADKFSRLAALVRIVDPREASVRALNSFPESLEDLSVKQDSRSGY